MRPYQGADVIAARREATPQMSASETGGSGD